MRQELEIYFWAALYVLHAKKTRKQIKKQQQVRACMWWHCFKLIRKVPNQSTFLISVSKVVFSKIKDLYCIKTVTMLALSLQSSTILWVWLSPYDAKSNKVCYVDIGSQFLQHFLVLMSTSQSQDWIWRELVQSFPSNEQLKPNRFSL